MFQHQHRRKDGKREEGQKEAQDREPSKEIEMDKLKNYIK